MLTKCGKDAIMNISNEREVVIMWLEIVLEGYTKEHRTMILNLFQQLKEVNILCVDRDSDNCPISIELTCSIPAFNIIKGLANADCLAYYY